MTKLLDGILQFNMTESISNNLSLTVKSVENNLIQYSSKVTPVTDNTTCVLFLKDDDLNVQINYFGYLHTIEQHFYFNKILLDLLNGVELIHYYVKSSERLTVAYNLYNLINIELFKHFNSKQFNVQYVKHTNHAHIKIKFIYDSVKHSQSNLYVFNTKDIVSTIHNCQDSIYVSSDTSTIPEKDILRICRYSVSSQTHVTALNSFSDYYLKRLTQDYKNVTYNHNTLSDLKVTDKINYISEGNYYILSNHCNDEFIFKNILMDSLNHISLNTELINISVIVDDNFNTYDYLLTLNNYLKSNLKQNSTTTFFLDKNENLIHIVSLNSKINILVDTFINTRNIISDYVYYLSDFNFHDVKYLIHDLFNSHTKLVVKIQDPSLIQELPLYNYSQNNIVYSNADSNNNSNNTGDSFNKLLSEYQTLGSPSDIKSKLNELESLKLQLSEYLTLGSIEQIKNNLNLFRKLYSILQPRIVSDFKQGIFDCIVDPEQLDFLN